MRIEKMQDDKTVTLGLTETVTANGVIRVDTVKTKDQRKVRMGFYALPELGKPVTTTETKVKGKKSSSPSSSCRKRNNSYSTNKESYCYSCCII